MTPADRAALRALLAAATPGPWEHRHHDGQHAICGSPGWVMEGDRDESDGPLIVALRNSAPALLDALDAAESVGRAYAVDLDRARREHEALVETRRETAERERDEARSLLDTIDAAHSKNKPSISEMALSLQAMRTERDTAEAALVALYGAADAWGRWCETHHGDAYLTQPSRGLKMAFDAALSTKRADLAARVRARHRAEAIEECALVAEAKGVKIDGYCFGQGVARWLRALAADAEKGGTR